MATLYELTGMYQQLLDLMQDEDEDEEVLADTLEGIEGEIEVKADGYAKIIAEITARAEAIKNEEIRLSIRRKSLENRCKWLKSKLQEAMEATGKTKFKTDLFSFNVQKNGGLPPLIIDIADYEDLPEDMRIVNYEPDNKKIREYLKAGNKLDWARLGEPGYSLRIR